MLERARPNAATEVLAGLVERVTFHNEENGFCVLRVKARTSFRAETGPMPRIMPELRYFSIPSTVVGAATLRNDALNCTPWTRSLTQPPLA